MELPFGPVIPLLGIFPKDPKTPIQGSLCIPMFIEALFTVPKSWKQPKCPSVDEWIIKSAVYFHNGILHSRKKRTPTFCNSMDRTGDYCAK